MIIRDIRARRITRPGSTDQEKTPKFHRASPTGYLHRQCQIVRVGFRLGQINYSLADQEVAVVPPRLLASRLTKFRMGLIESLRSMRPEGRLVVSAARDGNLI